MRGWPHGGAIKLMLLKQWQAGSRMWLYKMTGGDHWKYHKIVYCCKTQHREHLTELWLGTSWYFTCLQTPATLDKKIRSNTFFLIQITTKIIREVNRQMWKPCIRRYREKYETIYKYISFHILIPIHVHMNIKKNIYININIFIYGCINVWGFFWGSVWGFFFALYVVPSSGFCLGVCLGNFFRPIFLGIFCRPIFSVGSYNLAFCMVFAGFGSYYLAFRMVFAGFWSLLFLLFLLFLLWVCQTNRILILKCMYLYVYMYVTVCKFCFKKQEGGLPFPKSRMTKPIHVVVVVLLLLILLLVAVVVVVFVCCCCHCLLLLSLYIAVVCVCCCCLCMLSLCLYVVVVFVCCCCVCLLLLGNLGCLGFV